MYTGSNAKGIRNNPVYPTARICCLYVIIGEEKDFDPRQCTDITLIIGKGPESNT